MKKMIFTLFIILFSPIITLAYSKYIIPGGESIGIRINTDGLIVAGFYEVDSEYIAKRTLKIGDKIVSINNKKVNSIEELTSVIDDNINEKNEVNITIIRNDKIINTVLNLKIEDSVYKTGLYVKDSITGLGTLTYIDPITKIYGALGHEIMLNETNRKVEVKNGNILLSKVTSINKSRNGNVGSKNAVINYDKKLGSIVKNTTNGIFGKYVSLLPGKSTLEIAEYDSIKLGTAHIYTVTKDEEVEKYKINILDKYNGKRNTQKAFSFEIVDKDLLSKTGGIVQGMSGSPIIQNNRIIGAVTNVLVDNVTLGYGISIITMLEEGEK